MENKHNQLVAEKVEEKVTDIRLEIHHLINDLIEIKSYTSNPEKLAMVEELLDKLQKASKISPLDLGLSAGRSGYTVGDDFNKPGYFGYTYREKRYNRLDSIQKERENKNQFYLVARLQQKKGKIMKKQLNITNKIVKTNFYEYEKKNKLFIDKVKKEIKKLKKASSTKAIIKEYNYNKRVEKVKNGGSISRFEGIKMDVSAHQLDRRVNSLKKKIGKMKTKMDEKIASSVSQSLINKMRSASRIVGNIFDHVRYAIPNMIEDSKSR